MNYRNHMAVAVIGVLLLGVTACDTGNVSGSLINDGTTQRAIQFNAWGAMGSPTTHNDNVAADILASLRARNPKPFAMSLNEICLDQWYYLWNNYFGLNGYVAEAQWASVSATANGATTGTLRPGGGGRYYSNLNAQCNSFGNVSVVLGTSASRSIRYFANQAPGNLSSHEYKGATCVVSNLYFSVGCSAHTTASSTPYANQQLYEYASFVNPWVGNNAPMFVMGDFNLKYSEAQGAFDGWWYANFSEADLTSGRSRSGKMSTTNAGRPIDYIFRRVPAAFSRPVYIFNTASSDHHWYEGYL